jgi:hypothetical protein
MASTPPWRESPQATVKSSSLAARPLAVVWLGLGVAMTIVMLGAEQPVPRAIGPGPRQAAGSPAFVLAISDSGKALEPIGRFTGSAWVNTWPPPDEPHVTVPPLDRVPLSWLGKRVPRQWTLWQNGDRRTVTVTGTRRGDASGGGCTSPAVLTLTAPQGPPDTRDDIALAVDTAQEIVSLRALGHSDIEWAQLQPFVAEMFRANEQRAMRNGNRRWFVEALARAKTNLASVPIRVEAVVRPAGTARPPLYYVVAARRADTGSGTVGVIIWGWTQRDATGRWSALGVTGHSFGDDTPGNGLNPLGVLRVGTRTFWVMSRTGYESLGYEIYEVTASDVVRTLAVASGEC